MVLMAPYSDVTVLNTSFYQLYFVNLLPVYNRSDMIKRILNMTF